MTRQNRMSNFSFLFLALIIMLCASWLWQLETRPAQLDYSQVRQLFIQEKVESFTIDSSFNLTMNLREEREDGVKTLHYRLYDFQLFYDDLNELVRTQYHKGILTHYDYPPPKTTNWLEILLPALLTLLAVGLMGYFFLFRAQGGGMGPDRMAKFGTAHTRTLTEKDRKITFDDVAGADEEKEELREIVEFLKEPQRFLDLGARIPKGVLLVGPPGTGKTLLAKAVAGEANVPFFSISGSDFVEMFVGVGASRVRDLFDQAKKTSPAIVFIDEIDAVGRARGKNPNMGSNDERENTLNQMLTEMDGFGSNNGVIVLAATNRADMLDKALLRPGRFDRQIYVDLPELTDRMEIFNVHLRNIKANSKLDVEQLARQTQGFSGADIANVCNEAALIAARNSKKAVDWNDFMAAIDRIVGGLEKRSRIITDEEKFSIATHEAGHATITWLTEYGNPLVKVTIVPRGRALGAAWYAPEARQIMPTQALLDTMCGLLAGRAAEDLFTGQVGTGASDDLEKCTKIARSLVMVYGMSDKLPNINYNDSTGQDYGFTKPYSDETAMIIDNEVKRIINEQYERAKQILTEYKEQHHAIRDMLVKQEVIYHDDVQNILGKRKWKSRTDEIIEINKKEEEQRKKNGVEENPYADLFDEEASRHNRKRNRPLDSSDNSDSSDNPDSSDSSDEDSGTPPPFTK